MGDGIAPEGDAVGGAQRLIGKGFVHQALLDAEGGRPLLNQALEAAGHRRGEQGDLVGLSLATQVAELLGQELFPFLPGNWLEFARGVPEQGLANAVGVVEALQGGLPADAEPAAIDGVLGVALDLDRASLARSHQHSTTGRAFAADGGVPGRHAGNDIFRRYQIGDELFHRRLRAAGHGRACAGDPDDFQKISAFDVAHLLLSSDKLRNPPIRFVVGGTGDTSPFRANSRG